MKRLLIPLCALLLLIPIALVLGQVPPTLEITGVNASNLPITIVSASVIDNTGRTVPNLTVADFELSGAFADVGTVVSVESTTDESVSFGVVLAIDTSSSMAGFPLDKAKEAATTFIDSIGDNDPVAIVSFNTEADLIVPFTTDKTALKLAIDNLGFGGQTALYEAALLAVQTAAEAPVERRAVVIVSDGAQFGVVSNVASQAALDEAAARGVSIYTIGLGYGADRPYLQRLADNTNANFNESPTPDQLQEIFQGLASLFRSQYIITLEADVPLDGTEYDLTIKANTAQGTTNEDTATVRAPVPVPVVRFPDLTAPISEVTTITPDVLADDGVDSLTATIDGIEATVESGGVVINPVALSPGTHELSVTATDTGGDATTASVNFDVAALASALTVSLDPSSPVIEAITNVTVAGEGQTALSEVNYALADINIQSTDVEGNFATALDPFLIPMGEQVLTVIATNAGGVVTTVEVPLLVAPIAPTTTLAGIEDGVDIADIATIDAAIQTQQGATATTTLTVDGEEVELPFTLDPALYPPGALDIVLTTTDTNGQTTTQELTVNVADQGIEAVVAADFGGTVSETVELPIEVTSQTPIASASVTINGVTTELTPDGNSVPLTIDPEAIGENGDFVATVTITNENGTTTTVEIPFTVSGIATPTPEPSATPRVTSTRAAATAVSSTAEPTVVAAVATDTNVPATSEPTVVAAVASPTAAQVGSPSDANTRATARANATSFANVAATNTSSVASTVAAIAAATDTAVQNASATAAANATDNTNATATDIAQETAGAIITQQTIQTVTANVQLTATENAAASETAGVVRSTTVARVVTSTAAAAGTTSANAQATRTANAESTVQAASDATGTAANAPTETTEATEQVVPTLEETAEATEEETPVVDATTPPTVEVIATLTPVSGLQTGGDQTPPTQTDIVPYIVCGGAALLLALLLFLLSRGRRVS